jgi:hypothetical protein
MQNPIGSLGVKDANPVAAATRPRALTAEMNIRVGTGSLMTGVSFDISKATLRPFRRFLHLAEKSETSIRRWGKESAV